MLLYFVGLHLLPLLAVAHGITSVVAMPVPGLITLTCMSSRPPGRMVIIISLSLVHVFQGCTFHATINFHINKIPFKLQVKPFPPHSCLFMFIHSICLCYRPNHTNQYFLPITGTVRAQIIVVIPHFPNFAHTLG